MHTFKWFYTIRRAIKLINQGLWQHFLAKIPLFLQDEVYLYHTIGIVV
jgi:hypothetical protein